jgi:hypothetical protein
MKKATLTVLLIVAAFAIGQECIDPGPCDVNDVPFPIDVNQVTYELRGWFTIIAETQFNTNIEVCDPDGDTVNLVGLSLPAGAQIVEDAQGLFWLRWNPTMADTGTHYIDLQASDPYSTTEATFVVKVRGNLPPVIIPKCG